MSRDQDNISDRSAAIFFILLNSTFIPAYTIAFVFPEERPIVNRERASGMYSTLPYYISSSLADIPFQISFILIEGIITYWMIGLNSEFSRFIIFLVILLLALLVMQSSALCISAISSNTIMANLLMGVEFLIFMSFAGFFLNIRHVPPYFLPFEYISPYKYSFRALLQNDYKGLNFNCGCNSTMANSNCTLSCIPTGDAALQILNMDNSSVLADCLTLVGFCIFYRVLSYVLIRFIKFDKE